MIPSYAEWTTELLSMTERWWAGPAGEGWNVRNTALRLLAAGAAGSLLLAACGAADDAEDTGASDGTTAEDMATDEEDHDDHDHGDEEHGDHDHGDEEHGDHDHGEEAAGVEYEEVAGAEPRLVVADAADPAIHVVDLATEEILGTFDSEVPGALLHLGGEKRVVAAVQPRGDVVQFIDPGSWAWTHGDHAHYYVGEPRLLDAQLDIGFPVHVTTGFERFAIFGDTEGSGIFVDELSLLEAAEVEGELVQTGRPHHGGLVQLSEDLAVISGPAEDQDGGLPDEVWVLYQGEQVSSHDCPSLHGEKRADDWTGFACGDRVLLLEPHGDHVDATEIFYPEELGEDFRLGYLNTTAGSNTFVASSGDQLVFIDADAGELTPVQLPTETAARSIIDDDGNVLVLTDDGILHQFDLDSFGLVASSEEAVTIDAGNEAPRLSLAGGRDRAYVPVPLDGVVHEFATNDGLRLTRTMELGGAPAQLAYVGAWPT